MRLTPKKQRFVEEYVVDFNGVQACIRAGYSRKTAHSMSRHFLTDPDIQRMVKGKMEALREHAELSAQKVVHELALLAFVDMKDFVEWDDLETKLIPAKSLAPGLSRCVQEIRQTQNGIVFKLYNKVDALDKLARYFHLFADQIEIPGLEKSVDALLAWFEGLNDMQLRNLQKSLTNGQNTHS